MGQSLRGMQGMEKPDEGRLAEIAYHKSLNRWITAFGTPAFVFFALFYGRRGDYFQALLFALMAINAVVALLWGFRITEVKALVRLKRVAAGIAFFLLAVSLAAGVLNAKHFYGFIPWIFIYPIAVLLFFGQRIGLLCALFFCSVMAVILLTVYIPPWSAWTLGLFRLNAASALLTILVIALIAEKYRVRVQRQLVAAQDEYKNAEQRQRAANVELQREIERRSRSEQALAESEKRYRALFEESATPLWEEDWSQLKTYLDQLPAADRADIGAYCQMHPEVLKATFRMATVTAVNRASLHLFEADRAETLIARRATILPQDATQFLVPRMAALYAKGRHENEAVAYTLGGRPLHLSIASTVPAGFEASWKRVFTSIYDITERVAIEQEKIRVAQQLQHGRQIEAIATLAGGIAHQFNNALAIISGNLDLLEIKARPQVEERPHWDALRASASRMGRLTDQLLAYAHGGKYQPRRFSANNLIRTILAEKAIVTDPAIRLITELEADLHAATGDTTQIAMVIEAVLANAAEAMDNGGVLRISTANLRIEADPNLRSGAYAVIRIEDNGAGMDAETLERIFEPFYTTKLYGRGLGMAAAYGILRNHDGMITVASEPNKGTRVIICLPGTPDQESRSSSSP
jgi:signal transduction histidine kinase